MTNTTTTYTHFAWDNTDNWGNLGVWLFATSEEDLDRQIEKFAALFATDDNSAAVEAKLFRDLEYWDIEKELTDEEAREMKHAAEMAQPKEDAAQQLHPLVLARLSEIADAGE